MFVSPAVTVTDFPQTGLLFEFPPGLSREKDQTGESNRRGMHYEYESNIVSGMATTNSESLLDQPHAPVPADGL